MEDSLLCQEDKSCLNEEDEDKTGNPFLNSPSLIPCCDYDFEYEDDYIKLLVQNEIQTNFGSKFSGFSSQYPSWLKLARFDAIDWILHAQTLLRFRNQTAYLSVTYFDRFLSLTCIDEGKLWAIRLLSIACLSLAAKMEECQVPAFSGYPIEEEYGFGCNVIQKMELFVLTTMGWKMSLVTPFAYFNYFTRKLSDQGAKLDELVSRSMELVIALLKEINSIEHRPSVIAAAAVLAATDWELTQEALKCKISTVPLWQTSENLEEELFFCYSLMKRLSPNGKLSTPSLPEVEEKLCATTSIMGSKRRLTFSDSDSDHNLNLPEKIHRH